MNEKRKIDIGLDIGIASVGWAILDHDSKEVIDFGARLFDEATTQNVERREYRAMRRQIRRKANRKKDLIKLFIKQGWIEKPEDYFQIVENNRKNFYGPQQEPIDLQFKGLSKPLENHYLMLALYNYMTHRGFFYDNDQYDEKLKKKEKQKEEKRKEYEEKGKEYKEHKEKNQKFKEERSHGLKEIENLKKNYPNEIFELPTQIRHFYYTKYRTLNNASINITFTNEQWKKEIEKFLANQNVSKQFCEEYLAIFTRIRDYSQGPGSEKSPTPFGLYRKDLQTNKVIKISENLWDALVGKCSVYSEENRSKKYAPSSEVFNLLNELNNLSYKGKYGEKTSKSLSEEIKRQIFEKLTQNYQTKNTAVTLEFLRKLCEENGIEFCTENSFEGYPAKNSDKPKKEEEFQKMKSTAAIVKWLFVNKLKLKIDILNDLKLLDDIFEAVAKYNINKKQCDYLKKGALLQIFQNYQIDANVCDDLINDLIEKIDKSTLTMSHSLSKKAIYEYIEVGVKQSFNSSTYFYEKTVGNLKKMIKPNSKKIPSNYFDDKVISPTAKRSFRQTINLFNRILKLYAKKHELKNVVIEMARDKNSNEKRKRIAKLQTQNKNLLVIALKGSNFNPDSIESNRIKEKIKLWYQQDCQDIYDGERIDLKDIIDKSVYDIDHIIPYSISYDNSLNNKVLSSKLNNATKSQKTPLQWLKHCGNKKIDQYLSFVEKLYKNKKIWEDKRDNLLYDGDPNDLKKFVGRNLVDTRYASRLALTLFKSFFENNSHHPNVKVKTVRGKVTSYFRNNLLNKNNEFKKDRDDNWHHAIDASIVAFLGTSEIIQKLIDKYTIYKLDNEELLENEDQEKFVDNETGEVLTKKSFIENFSNNQFIEFKKSLQIEKCKFSRMLMTKNNSKISNETVYSFKRNLKEKDSSTIYAFESLELTSIKKNDVKRLKKLFEEEFETIAKMVSNDSNDENKWKYTNLDFHLFKKLKEIWDAHGKSETYKIDNHFVNYMNWLKDNYKDLIKNWNICKNGVCFLNPKKLDSIELVVKKIKIICSKSQSMDMGVVFLKKHNNKAVLKGIIDFEARIYMDKNKKLRMIPINSKNAILKDNQVIVQQEKLNEYLKHFKIEDMQNYVVLKKGTIFLRKEEASKEKYKSKFYYSLGTVNSLKKNKIEIKPLALREEKQTIISVNTLSSNFYFCNVDELGNYYNKKEIGSFFENKKI